MLNKGFKKLLAVALLSTIGLVACDKDVHAKPTDYDKPLVALTESEDEIYHNLMSILEDAYRDGSLASATLDKILYTYSVSVFGRYNTVSKPYDLSETTLKEAAEQIAVDTDGNVTGPAAKHDLVDAFIESHKAYWTTDNDGNRVAEDKRGNTEYARVYAKWKTIEDRIARHFYGNISSGYTNDRKYFSEKKYLAELRANMGKVLNPYEKPLDEGDNPTMTVEEHKIVVTPEVQEEDVFTEKVVTAKKQTADPTEYVETTYLHRENYQDKSSYELDASASESAIDSVKARYVEDEVIPTIYRSLLVEQYLLDESYNNLGRSAARKVNVISISANANNDRAADYLAKYFVRNRIGGKEDLNNPATPANPDDDTPIEITIEDFKEVSNAMIGLVDESGKNAYIDAVNSAFGSTSFPHNTEDVDPTNHFYVGTDFGDMMAKYIKIKDDINTTDTSAESDFTGSYTHTKEVGKEIKINEIKKNDYVTDGWFIKSNSVGDLPDSIKTRLFNIEVSNVLDSDTATDRFVKENNVWNYKVPENESKLVATINGKHYLKVGSKQSGADIKDDILFYEGGKYYVVQIEEAVSGSKLAKEATTEKYSESKKEEIINEVARVVANNDTYQSASTKHWLEQAAIKFHDSKIYDYFKENYPDLFGDDD